MTRKHGRRPDIPDVWVAPFPMVNSRIIARGARRAVWEMRRQANEVLPRAPMPGRVGKLLRVEQGWNHVRAVFEVIRRPGARQ